MKRSWQRSGCNRYAHCNCDSGQRKGSGLLLLHALRNNETDQTGCFDWANGYLVKATSYRDAAIRVDTNSGNYSVRTTINANQYTRATDWAWIACGRKSNTFLSQRSRLDLICVTRVFT